MSVSEIFIFPPVLIMLAGALLLPFLPRTIRSSAFLFFTFLTLAYIWVLPDGSSLTVPVMDYSLVLCKVDALTRIFGIIFAFIAFAGGIYSFHIKETGQQCAALLYAGGAIGVTFAGDLFTLFIFWEMMAFTSLYLIWARRSDESRHAGFRYLIYHAFGGGMLFAGILMHLSETGSLAVTQLKPSDGISAWLILLGVAINAAVPPLHAWLSDAYPKATVTGAVFLSAFTTKSAVYVLIRIFPGWEILLVLGVIMTIYGVIFAVLSNDIRGILAYHIISQVGYMVSGVGLGTYMALNGSAAHAFSHILYKALLFMGAGVVLHATGKSKLTQLGGLSRSMPVTLWLYMIAAFSISGVPLFNGFISKSMVVAAAGEAHYPWAFLGLNLAAVGTFLSVGLKLPYFTWFSREKPKDLTPQKPPLNMHIGMGLVAFFCILHGIMPSLLYKMLPFENDFHPYNMPHLVESVQILAFTFIGFWVMRKILAPHATIALDLDWFYRRPKKFARQLFVDAPAYIFDEVEKAAYKVVRAATNFGKNPYVPFTPPSRDKAYTPDRYRPATQFLVLAILAVFLLLTLWGIFF
jgi:multicomponent Na+:H+ antiporter subunit D